MTRPPFDYGGFFVLGPCFVFEISIVDKGLRLSL